MLKKAVIGTGILGLGATIGAATVHNRAKQELQKEAATVKKLEIELAAKTTELQQKIAELRSHQAECEITWPGDDKDLPRETWREYI